MLVVDPRERATLQEIMNHPWMTKGFGGPPENYLPVREALSLPLNPEVIEKMQGFDFGSASYITEQLTRVVESEDYQSAIRRTTRDDNSVTPGNERKRGVFDFYRRRNSISREGLSAPSAEAIRGHDPLNAYNPLISVYYLVKEKRERERTETNPGGLALPLTSDDQPLKMPGLPSPEAAHTNTFAPEMPGEKATGGRSRPRARTNGEEEVVQSINTMVLGEQPRPGRAQAPPPPSSMIPHPDQPAKKEGTAMGLLRRFSTRRVKDRDADRSQPPAVNVQPPQDPAGPSRKSFSVRRSRKRDPSPGTLHAGGSQPQHDGLLSAPPVSGASRTSKFLGRSTSVNSADYRPRRLLNNGASEAVDSPRRAPEPPQTSGSDHSAASGQRSNKGVELTDRSPASASPVAPPRSPIAARTRSLGHARQDSIQARRQRRDDVRKDKHANVPEETDADLKGDGSAPVTPAVPDAPGADISRPGGLKGLFSSSTTSNKPPQFIRHDIIRVLKQLGVEYTEIKGGFSCRHAPSINLEEVRDYSSPLEDEKGGRVVSGHQRRISFGRFSTRDKDDFRDEKLNRQSSRRRQPDQSFITNSEGSEEYVPHAGRGHNDPTRDMAATTTRVQDETGGRLVLKFEIAIVKIPLFNLHGIQFKKVQGGMNQYRSMTSTILNSLRL